MWVKIKSKKIPDTVLTVPYEAFVSIFSKKGFVLVEDKTAKNSTDKVIENKETTKESTIKLDKEELEELSKIKADASTAKPSPKIKSATVEQKQKIETTTDVKAEVKKTTTIKR